MPPRAPTRDIRGQLVDLQNVARLRCECIFPYGWGAFGVKTGWRQSGAGALVVLIHSAARVWLVPVPVGLGLALRVR